jgi:hypothetical protein
MQRYCVESRQGKQGIPLLDLTWVCQAGTQIVRPWHAELLGATISPTESASQQGLQE